MREGDYSFRVRGGDRSDPYGELMAKVHGGSVTVSDRQEGVGCIARVWLPLA